MAYDNLWSNKTVTAVNTKKIKITQNHEVYRKKHNNSNDLGDLLHLG